MKLLRDRILVERITQNTTPGGIIIGTSLDVSRRGKVIDLGPQVKGINKDDIVVYPEYAGMTVSLDGKEYDLLVDIDVPIVL